MTTREAHAAYMREYMNDPTHPERKEKATAYLREYYRRNRQQYSDRARSYYAANAETIKARVREKRRRRRVHLAELKLAGCASCGTQDAIDFHHVDPSTKDFPLGGTKAIGVSEERFLAEIEKCILLCEDCHWDEHRMVA